MAADIFPSHCGEINRPKDFFLPIALAAAAIAFFSSAWRWEKPWFLVGGTYLSLWKISVSQLGWWTSQYTEKTSGKCKMVQTNNQVWTVWKTMEPRGKNHEHTSFLHVTTPASSWTPDPHQSSPGMLGWWFLVGIYRYVSGTIHIHSHSTCGFYFYQHGL